VRSAVGTTTVDVKASENAKPGVAGALDAPSANATLSGLYIHMEATATRVSGA